MISYTLLEFDSLSSTSDFLKENQAYFPHMTFIRANHQTQGRGQFDRMWQSEANQNILCSILLKEINISKASLIKLWVMESVIGFLQRLGINAMFKEPNDIYVGDDKLCGILIETKSTENEFDFVVIGIGLNVNQMIFERANATSLKKILHQEFDLNELFSSFLDYMVQTYERYDL
jgi:BirA family transcriptional regulator, biotin operon repressor / biotin---[acetyl-CoA-carboxylase] ligase